MVVKINSDYALTTAFNFLRVLISISNAGDGRSSDTERYEM